MFEFLSVSICSQMPIVITSEEINAAESELGLGLKSPGSILISRTETSSLSRAVRDGWDASSVPASW